MYGLSGWLVGWLVGLSIKTDNTAYQALVLVWLWCGKKQTWNTAFLLRKQILQILLYTALFEYFQCNMREHKNKLYTRFGKFIQALLVLRKISKNVKVQALIPINTIVKKEET